MNCHYNDEIELVCVNESMMDAYGHVLTKVYVSPPNIDEHIVDLSNAQVKHMFCANCLQLQLILALRRSQD